LVHAAIDTERRRNLSRAYRNTYGPQSIP